MHKERHEEFKCYDQIDKALKFLLTAAADEVCIRTLRDKHMGSANVTTKQLMKHLHDTHAQINEQDLKKNDKRLKKSCNPNQPFEALVDQAEDAVDCASAGNALCTAKQIVKLAHDLIFETGVHNDDCKIWRAKPDGEKTQDEFKKFFQKACEDLNDIQATARTSGHQANNSSTITDDQINSEA